ncbi:hypothetical protein [Parasulfitobacter algicola]|nr:hypothetical protein [Sulfitobacter algicola]
MKEMTIKTEKIKAWLTSNVTITAPGWVVASAGAAAIVLLLIALD